MLTFKLVDGLRSESGRGATLTESTRTDDFTLRRRGQFRLLFVTLGVLVVGVVGYLGFVAFVTSDQAAGSGVLALGALTGFAAFFSPCSYPMLMTFLARRGEESKGTALLSALRVGLGATLMLAVIGLVMAVGGAALGSIVQFDQPLGRAFRLAVGGVLIVLGLKQSRLVNFKMGWMYRFAGRTGRRFDPSQTTTRAGSDFLYGFGFLLAGFG